MLFGFLCEYIIAIAGHQKGVVINMTTKEVETAEQTKNGAHIIRVSIDMLINIIVQSVHNRLKSWLLNY